MNGVIYFDETIGWTISTEGNQYPLHFNDVKKLNQTIFEGDEVEYIIIDEFTHPNLFDEVGWGLGDKCFKIIN